jgi:hypothetical protein
MFVKGEKVAIEDEMFGIGEKVAKVDVISLKIKQNQILFIGFQIRLDN